MPLMYPEIHSKQEMQEEKQELLDLLDSGIFSKAPNLQHFLDFIAERYFAGEADQVKEYSIAVHALKRPETFDPQSDTIVRVTAHTLRKRLEQYYATQGATHAIQIQLPAGKYVLRFVHRKEAAQPAEQTPSLAEATIEAPVTIPVGVTAETPSVAALAETEAELQRHPFARWLRSRQGVFGAAGVGLLVLSGLSVEQVRRVRSREAVDGIGAVAGATAGGHMAASGDTTMRLTFGEAAGPYLDAAGRSWNANDYCKGGSTFTHPDQEIRGTDDAPLFREGREGKFHCRIPVPPGMYELHLLFADTAGDKEAARQVVFTLNNGPSQALDVVDEAGANNMAMGKVYAGLHPMQDGFIHLDFISDGSFVNAAELLPSRSDLGEPLRMLAGPATFRDTEGNSWGPERFFVGGRRTFHPDNLPNTANPRLFEWERYGHFHYAIPVIPGRQYSIRLYFSEGWFGTSNGGPGGPDSRLFDVYCNGTTLLKNFDILRDQRNGTVVIKADHVRPTANGVLELYFTPVKNYPLINAIEVTPES